MLKNLEFYFWWLCLKYFDVEAQKLGKHLTGGYEEVFAKLGKAFFPSKMDLKKVANGRTLCEDRALS